MPGAFCCGCERNWSHVATAEDEGDEEYDYCPICMTGEYLEDERPGITHSFNHITGEVIDNSTSKPIIPEYPPPPPVKPARPYDIRNEEVLRGRHNTK